MSRSFVVDSPLMRIQSFVFLILTPLFASASAEYRYATNKIKHISVPTLAACMTQEAQKFSGWASTLEPNIYYQNAYDNTSCEFDSQDFWNYLRADFRRCDDSTGNEAPLRDWILNQANNSITPITLVRESLTLNHGQFFDSILTIHQLLRNEARYRDKVGTFYSSNPQKERVFWNKFIDIRGDLAERGPPFVGDHEGSWYRFYGIILYRWVQTRELHLTASACVQVKPSAAKAAEARFKTDGVAIAAEAQKLLFKIHDFRGYHPGGDLLRKAEINFKGAELASRIYDLSQDISLNHPTSCEPSDYLINEK